MISLAFLIITVLFSLSFMIPSRSIRFAIFADLPSLLFVLLGITGYFLLFGRKEFSRGIKTFFAFSYPLDEQTSESGRFFLRLTEFTLVWGVFGMVLGLVCMMFNLDPDTFGPVMAISLLSPLYALGLALFVFLPIGLRLSPPTVKFSVFWRFPVYSLLLLGLIGFFLLRCLIVFLLPLVYQTSAQGFGAVVQQAAFTLNPADPTGNYSLFQPYGFFMYWDPPGIILMVASWWLFRMASGKRRRWIGAPVIILIGLFWSIQCFVMLLSKFTPEMIGPGFAVVMLTTFYGFLAAAGFLIADCVKSGDYAGVPAPSPAL